MGQHNGVTPPPRPLVSFTPVNMQEHENDIRAIVNTHQGFGGGNPSQWVVNAGLECFSRGFGEGFAAARRAVDAKVVEPVAKQLARNISAAESVRGLPVRPLLLRRVNQAGDSLEDWLASEQELRAEVQAGDRNAERMQWLAFFTAALGGTSASAGDSDDVVNFARQIADAALQAWLER